MDGKQTLKYALYHELLGVLSAVVGLGLVIVGVFLGLGESITIVMNRAPADWGDAVAAAQPVTFLAVAVVGVLIWQLGKSITAVKTAEKVVAETGDGTATGEGADAEQLTSEVMETVDDRVSDIESAVQENRRHIEAVNETAEAAKAKADSEAGDAGGGSGSAADAGASGSVAADEGSSTEESTESGDDAGSGSAGRRSRRRSGSSGSGGDDGSTTGQRGASDDTSRDSASNRRSNRRSSRGSRDDDE